jgi:hypothetical protein
MARRPIVQSVALLTGTGRPAARYGLLGDAGVTSTGTPFAVDHRRDSVMVAIRYGAKVARRDSRRGHPGPWLAAGNASENSPRLRRSGRNNLDLD